MMTTTMDRVQHSFDNFGLHLAAIKGDDEGVRRALESGADVNALDQAGRNVIMCVVAGEDWEKIDASDASFMTASRLDALRTLLGHPDISLYTLNSPQTAMNGVTPLGMAAWLNNLEAVHVLLDGSAETVSVDGMDSHGATALMYAARDGGLNVVQLLLCHGARPDFRDRNHRTSIQYALAHPQILWLCESVLRRHRWRESEFAHKNKLYSDSELLLELTTTSLPPCDILEPPPLTVFTKEATSRITDTLIQSIHSSDLSFLHSLLFSPPVPPSSPPALYPMSSPVLVNRPDSQGWSPIHHCVSVEHPSIDVLDALYCAGADVTLFTTNEHYTPLHCLAQSACLTGDHPDSALYLYQFTVHLIHDLRAPLSARDKDDETCIHMAAEHGDCIDLLMIFLDCDTTGSVRELRNARGLTALEVAKPEFRAAFGEDAEKLRSVSSLSVRTIRPTTSFASMASFSDWHPAGQTTHDDDVSIVSTSDFDISLSSHQLLSNLRLTSPGIHHKPEPAHLDYLDSVLHETTHIGHVILRHFQARAEDAAKEFQEVRAVSNRINVLLDIVTSAVNDQLEERGLEPIRHWKRNRDSEDSQLTAVSGTADSNASFSLTSPSTVQLPVIKVESPDHCYVSVCTQTPLVGPVGSKSKLVTGSRSLPWSEWLDSFIFSADSTTYKAHLANLLEIERELCFYQDKLAAADGGVKTGSLVKDPKMKQLMKKKRKEEERMRDIEKQSQNDKSTRGTSKLKAWLKRKIMPDRPLRLEIVKEIDEDGCLVGRQVKNTVAIDSLDVFEDCHDTPDTSIEDVLRTSHVVLAAASRDLLNIGQCLTVAEQFLANANHSISRAERIISRAVKKREMAIANLRRCPNADPSDDQPSGSPSSLGYSNFLSSRPSTISLSSTCSSSQSSYVSVTATLTEADDDDTRAIRRLLLRKIEAGMGGALDEMDKINGWLRIVKEVVRGVKRRAYL